MPNVAASVLLLLPLVAFLTLVPSINLKLKRLTKTFGELIVAGGKED